MSLLASLKDGGNYIAPNDLADVQLSICSIQNGNSYATITLESNGVATSLRASYPILANDAYDFNFKINLKHKDKINFNGVGLCLNILQ